jgi:hypothetical protein
LAFPCRGGDSAPTVSESDECRPTDELTVRHATHTVPCVDHRCGARCTGEHKFGSICDAQQGSCRWAWRINAGAISAVFFEGTARIALRPPQDDFRGQAGKGRTGSSAIAQSVGTDVATPRAAGSTNGCDQDDGGERANVALRPADVMTRGTAWSSPSDRAGRWICCSFLTRRRDHAGLVTPASC